MKGLLRFLLLALAINGSSVFPGVSAQNAQYISVKDYGAKGDGKTDDTRAIQAAIDFAEKEGFSRPSIPGIYEKNTVYFGAAKTVFFPVGTYSISRSLKGGTYLRFIGEKAVLIPVSSQVNKMDAVQAVGWQASIEGLQFIAFRIALKLNNNNVDAGKISISDCDFMNNYTAIELNSKSAVNIIRENRFINNSKVLDIIYGDKVDMYDNWITAAPLSGQYGAQIINRGVLHFDKNLLVPVPPQTGAKEPAWINNYNLVTIDGVRQGGEPGSFTLVNNFAEANTTYPVWPNGVVISNSDCYAVYGSSGSYKAPAALRLINIPNNMVLQNLRGFVDAKLLDFTQDRDKKLQIEKKNYPKNSVMMRVENIQVPPFKHPNGSDVPEELLKFVVK